MSSTPKQSTIIRAAIERALANLAGGRPGRVESYDPLKQRADVQPLILDGSRDLATGLRRADRQPVITDVPVLMLGTARSRTTMDIRPGDTVWLCSASGSLDRYLIQGGEVDPQDDRRHSISDAVCFPAVFDFASVPNNASTDGIVLHTTRLRLGGPDASDPVVRKSDLDAVVTKLNTLIGLYNVHVHPVPGITAGPASTTSLVSVSTTGTMTSPACSLVVSSK